MKPWNEVRDMDLTIPPAGNGYLRYLGELIPTTKNRSVEFDDMKLSVWSSPINSALMIQMVCGLCEESVCMCFETTLDELRAEYSHHLTYFH